MTSMEKKLTENRLTEVRAALSAKYRTVDLGGEKFSLPQMERSSELVYFPVRWRW